MKEFLGCTFLALCSFVAGMGLRGIVLRAIERFTKRELGK